MSESLIISRKGTYYFEFLTERPTLKPTDNEITTIMKRQVSDPMIILLLLDSPSFVVAQFDFPKASAFS